MALKISKVGIDLIKSFEGCSLKAYRCPANVLTIGWGSTVGVKEGQVITQAQADAMLMKELSKFELAVNKLNVPLNQNQFDSLVSFCYNLGSGIFKGSLLSAIKSQNWTSVGSQMLLYDKARVKGVLQPLTGLTRRRKAESSLFLKDVETVKEAVTQDDKDLANAVSKIVKSGINIDFNQWKRVDLIKLSNVPALLNKLGGVDKLVSDKVIGDKQLWLTGKYNANHVRALLIKYGSGI